MGKRKTHGLNAWQGKVRQVLLIMTSRRRERAKPLWRRNPDHVVWIECIDAHVTLSFELTWVKSPDQKLYGFLSGAYGTVASRTFHLGIRLQLPRPGRVRLSDLLYMGVGAPVAIQSSFTHSFSILCAHIHTSPRLSPLHTNKQK